jgi:glycosyltransferase involved in cell wall biosynthesis
MASKITKGSIHYLCLQAPQAGQASYAHVLEIIKGLERCNWKVRLFEPSYTSSRKLPEAFGRLMGFLRAQWQLLHSPRPDILYIRAHSYHELPGIVAHSLAGLSPQNALAGRSKKGLLPIKVFETLACGVPVIVTDWPGQADLVRENQCGLVVPPDDPKAIAEAVAYLYYHPEERIMMGEKGRKLVELEYSWDRCAQKTSEILAMLVCKAPTGKGRE